jgi:dihydroorotate dehydrogenase (fumarate)
MDLSTKYLGLELPHPVTPGAGPLADDLDSVKRLQDAGAPLIALRSLFEEQIVGEQLSLARALDFPSESFAEATHYLPDALDFALGPDEYLEHLRAVKKATELPVVASLNGTTIGGWLDFAQRMEQAGADALELNLYELATDAARDSASVEQALVDVVAEVRRRVAIPLAVKLSPFFTALPHVARRIVAAGAGALVLFNRFYQPDIDPEALEIAPALRLSSPGELNLRLRWIALLHGRGECDLALTGGVPRNRRRRAAVRRELRAGRLVAAHARSGSSRDARRRAARMDGEERVPESLEDDRQHEPPPLPRPAPARARELCAHPAVVVARLAFRLGVNAPARGPLRGRSAAAA